jgi:hypothetical protein
VQVSKPRLLVAADRWITLRATSVTSAAYVTVKADSHERTDCVRRYLHDLPTNRAAYGTSRQTERRCTARQVFVLASEVTMGDSMFLLILGGGIWLAIAIAKSALVSRLPSSDGSRSWSGRIEISRRPTRF